VEADEASSAANGSAVVDPPAFLPAHLRALFSLIHSSPPLSPAPRPSNQPRVVATDDDDDLARRPASVDELAVRSAPGRRAPLAVGSGGSGQLVHRSREPSPDRLGSLLSETTGVWRLTAATLKASSTTTTPLLTTPAEEDPPGSAATAARAYFSGAELLHADSRPSPSPTSTAVSSPLATAVAASSISTTLLAPLTWVLSLAYLFLLLATTPSTFLPRLLSARWALSESAANTAVGLLYTLGGIGQFAVGWYAGRPEGPGLLATWRRAAAVTIGCWTLVAAFEVALGGEGVVALSASNSSGGGGKETGGWDWVGPPAARWTGVLLRLAATMGAPLQTLTALCAIAETTDLLNHVIPLAATPTLGSLYLSHTVSLPTSLIPNRAILTACVICLSPASTAVLNGAMLTPDGVTPRFSLAPQQSAISPRHSARLFTPHVCRCSPRPPSRAGRPSRRPTLPSHPTTCRISSCYDISRSSPLAHRLRQSALKLQRPRR